MNNTSKIKEIIVSISDSIISALEKMDGHRTKLVFVFDGEKFESILTIGDIQRAIIRHHAEIRFTLQKGNKLIISKM